MAPRHLISLGQVAERTRTLEAACSRCPRRGRVSIARLVAEHGPDTPLRHAVEDLNVNCPNQNAHQIHDRCDILFPGLVELMASSGNALP